MCTLFIILTSPHHLNTYTHAHTHRSDTSQQFNNNLKSVVMYLWKRAEKVFPNQLKSNKKFISN